MKVSGDQRALGFCESGALIAASNDRRSEQPPGLVARTCCFIAAEPVRLAPGRGVGQVDVRQHRSRTAMPARLQTVLEGMVGAW